MPSTLMLASDEDRSEGGKVLEPKTLSPSATQPGSKDAHLPSPSAPQPENQHVSIGTDPQDPSPSAPQSSVNHVSVGTDSQPLSPSGSMRVEMSCQTEEPVSIKEDEARDLYKRFKEENKNSTITFEQFAQILLMHKKGSQPKDTSHIAINDDVVFKASYDVEKLEKEERKKQIDKQIALQGEQRKKLLRAMAELHEALPPNLREELKQKSRGALRQNNPSIPMHHFANFVIDLCRQHIGDEDTDGLDLQITFREIFADLLAIPVDSFDKEQGGLPRRIFAHLMMRKRREEFQLSQKGVLKEEHASELAAVPEDGDTEGQGADVGGLTDFQKELLNGISDEKWERFHTRRANF